MLIWGTLTVRKLLWSSALSVLGTAYRNSDLLNYTYTMRYKTKREIKRARPFGEAFGGNWGENEHGYFEFHIVFRYESSKNKKNIKQKLTKYKRKKSCLRETEKEAVEGGRTGSKEGGPRP